MRLQTLIDAVWPLQSHRWHLNNPAAWPWPLRGGLLLLVAAALLALAWSLAIGGRYDRLATAVRYETELKDRYRDEVRHLANLDAYRAQVARLSARLDDGLRQLPGATDIPELIDDISRVADRSGLQIDRITPGSGQQRDRYRMTPISITVQGSYHQMGAFLSGLTALPRLLTLHDFSLRTRPDDGQSLLLVVQARLYRYQPPGGQ